MPAASAALESLFARYYDDPWGVIQAGETLLAKKKEKDALGVLHVMEDAVRVILSDIAEHGDANLGDYGDHDAAHFEALAKSLAARIKEAKKNGAKSDFFATRQAEKKKAYGSDRAEFLQSVSLTGVEKKLDAELGAAWAAADREDPGGRFTKALKAVLNLPHASPSFVDALACQCERMLLDCYMSKLPKRRKAAIAIVALYAEAQLKLGRSLAFGEEVVARAIATAEKTGDAKTAAVALAMVPRHVTSRTLAYLLARYWAAKRKKPEMLAWMRRARELGTGAHDFDDDAFLKYANDAAVAKLRKEKIRRRG